MYVKPVRFNMSIQEFDFWNHFCDAEKEIMRVEEPSITFFSYYNTEEQLPEWYNEDFEEEDDYTSELEYSSLFYDHNISIEEECDNVEYSNYCVSDSESDNNDDEWTNI